MRCAQNVWRDDATSASRDPAEMGEEPMNQCCSPPIGCGQQPAMRRTVEQETNKRNTRRRLQFDFL